MAQKTVSALIVAVLAVAVLLVFMVNRLEDRIVNDVIRPTYRFRWPAENPIVEVEAAREDGESKEAHFKRVHSMLEEARRQIEGK